MKPTEEKTMDWERDWLLFWGIAPFGSLKYKRGVEILHFFKKVISSSQDSFRRKVEEELNKYKCDFNWDFEKNKPKHKSYIALDDVLAKLKTLNK